MKSLSYGLTVFGLLCGVPLMAETIYTHPVKCISHHGEDDSGPIHSRPAYEASMGRKAEIMKLDVHFTRDEIPVLSHDGDLKRSMGWDVLIRKKTLAELRENGTFRPVAGRKNEKIMTLREGLEIVRNSPEFWIDIKGFFYKSRRSFELILPEFERAGISTDRIMLATWSDAALIAAKERVPKMRRIKHIRLGRQKDGSIKTNFFPEECLQKEDVVRCLLKEKERLGLYGMNLPWRAVLQGLLTLQDVQKLREAGIWCSFHIVNNREIARMLADAGADAFVTDEIVNVRPVCRTPGFREEEPVPASRFGFNAEDATECLEKALKSGAKRIRIDRQAGDWIIRPVSLPGNVEVILDPGVTVRAKKGEFKKPNDSLFLVRDVDNVIIRGGNGSRLMMNKADYQDKTQYVPAEWRHAVSICGSTNVTVKDLILEASGGDGAYVSSSKKHRTSTRILLENLDSVSNHRQGLSVISGREVWVRNCRFRDTDGTAPMAGIDLEPNTYKCKLEDCVVENCTMTGNKSYGFLTYLYYQNKKSFPVSIMVRNCDIFGSPYQPAVWVDCSRGAEQVNGFIRFENCRITGLEGGSIGVRNQRSDGFSLSFQNCTVDNAKSARPAFRIFCQTDDAAMGNFSIHNLSITDPQPREWCTLETVSAKPAITGALLFNGTKVDLAEWSKAQKVQEIVPFTPAKLNRRRLCPPAGPGKANPGMKFRSQFHFLQYAQIGTMVEIAMQNIKMGPVARTFPLEILGPDGKVLKTQTIEPGKNTVRFTAPQTGIYRLRGKTKGAGFSMDSALPGNGIEATKLNLIRSRNKKLYFEVPAGAREVMLRLSGDPGEFVTMRIFNHKNEFMGELKDVTAAKGFRYTRVFPEKSEVWRLEFPRMDGDAVLELGGDLNPIVSASPALLFRSK